MRSRSGGTETANTPHMRTHSCPPSPVRNDGNPQEKKSAAIAQDLVLLRAALDAHRLAADAASLADLRVALRRLADEMLTWPAREPAAPAVQDVLQAARVVWAEGFCNHQPPVEDLERATRALGLGWPGLIAGMLLVPCWAWDEAPRLAQAPDWLWGDFMQWVLAAPLAAAAPGIADLHLACITPYLGELAGWMERNRGSAAVRAAAAAFLDRSTPAFPLQTTLNLRPYAVARGRLLTAIARARRSDLARTYLPRVGRPLRVGILARDFTDRPENRMLLPLLQQVDRDQASLILIVAEHRRTPGEQAFRRVAAEFHVLPPEREARVQACARLACDVLLFPADLAEFDDDLTSLASQRLAPVQALLPGSLFTTGLPEVDFRFIGTATAEESTERLALLPGAGLGWLTAPAPATGPAPCREEFGLPADGTVFVSAARTDRMGTEILAAWGQLLAAVPGSALLIFQPTTADPFLTEELPARLHRLAGVDPARVVVTCDDARRGLALGDVYLDSHPTAEPEALAAALAAGLPAVAWSGDSHRAQIGAAVLRACGGGAQVAVDAASYVALATRLALDPDHRQAVRTAQQAGFAHGGGPTDALALADALVALLERTYDEVADAANRRHRPGPAAVRLGWTAAEMERLRARALAELDRGDAPAALAATWRLLQGEPSAPDARGLHARALLKAGKPARALTYALAALAGHEDEATRWIDAADVLRANGQVAPAIEAYEAALKLDGRRIEAWVAIAQLAAAAGHHEFATEAAAVARSLQPDDPRVTGLGRAG